MRDNYAMILAEAGFRQPPERVPSGAPKVSAVMPCLNEDRTIGACVAKAQSCFRAMGVEGEVIVVDNGSSDRSVEIATLLGARVVHQPVPGYGAAIQKGIESARGEFVVIADADDSYDWTAMRPFIERLESGFDVVVGNRFRGGIAPGAMPWLHRYVGNPLLSWTARALHGAPIHDFHCGMRALRRSAYDRMKVRTPGMEFATEMIVRAARAGLRLAEVPTTLAKDGRDRPPHLRSFRDGWRHLRFILAYAPNFLYVAPALAMIVPGLLLVALLAGGPVVLRGQYLGIHFLALACVLTLVGFNLLGLGVLAKVIGARYAGADESRLTRWAMDTFTLESGLVVGSLLAATGIGIDAYLLHEWLTHPGASMESTTHLAFVATLAIVLGVGTVFGSFLLSMLVAEERHPAGRSRPASPRR